MMIYNAPIKDMMFLIDEWIGMENITAMAGFEDVDRDLVQSILEAAGKFCSTELLPINRQGDEYAVSFEDGIVKTPPGFREAYQKFIASGWTGIDADPVHGGQGLPRLVQFQVDEMLCSCNLAFKLYSELSHGVYHLLAGAASAELRDRYLPRLVEGVWSGTMCLTEPHCGTDLGLLTTRASPNEDGSFDIRGTKIFVTSGDHDLSENILHMVLARLDDAPSGTPGISLFLVPRTLVNEDGSLGQRNHVSTGSIEHKMGIRGSATCVLNFDQAEGYLVGEENRGLAAMFKMMNLERITVGIQGLGFAEIAYQNALAYARERLQSKAPPPRPDPSRPADPIILQPDIKRQLLKIRCQVEGARALAVYAAYHADVMDKSDDAECSEESEDIVALLTPVVKSFLSDLGVSSTLAAQQVFGGHGYIREHGMEQLVRDSRIAPIYEGTNEVQAVDLVMRKLMAKNGRLANRYFEKWRTFFAQQKTNEQLNVFLEPALAAFEQLMEVTEWIRDKVQHDNAAARGAATDYQRMFGLTVIACLWAQIMVTIAGREGEFYATKRRVALFYMHHVLPETTALHEVIRQGADALSDFDVARFEL